MTDFHQSLIERNAVGDNPYSHFLISDSEKYEHAVGTYMAPSWLLRLPSDTGPVRVQVKAEIF
jgi:hypothetical protein